MIECCGFLWVEVEVESPQLYVELSHFPVIVENEGLAWDPRAKKCKHLGGDYSCEGGQPKLYVGNTVDGKHPANHLGCQKPCK